MKRFRDHEFSPGMLPTGKRNKISDVDGVTVGHVTRIEGDCIRTGVTVIDPGIRNILYNKLPAAVAVGNGYGKMAGISQIDELGTLESPIALTNTLAIGPAMHGLVELVLRITENLEPSITVNAVVGETSDGIVNDMHQIVITPADVAAAYENRTPDFALGSVGAGTGTQAFAWKGGIGSASRKVVISGTTYTVGALLQTNYNGALTIMGVPVGRLLGKTGFDRYVSSQNDGSCMMILATDAPLSSRQLGRLARRAPLGLARTGSVMSHGSGDYALAFSTRRDGVEGFEGGRCLPDRDLTPLFLAVVECVEESVYDSMFAAKTITGFNNNSLKQVPVARVVKLLRAHLPEANRE
ncbi:MAG TPA: P1 family peptidase [Candidatus Sumerlaeota bacterium]|nr:P1 family peptidase [Candidatus Sumerlaeota bacterium]